MVRYIHILCFQQLIFWSFWTAIQKDDNFRILWQNWSGPIENRHAGGQYWWHNKTTLWWGSSSYRRGKSKISFESFRNWLIEKSLFLYICCLILPASIQNVFLQEALLKNWIEVHSPPKLAQMESILKENNGGDGWFVGDDVSSLDTISLLSITE